MNYEQLKNSILQQAIEGRLVPQDPTDEPASVLLDRIAAEKAELVKAKKIKKDKNESRIYRTEDGHWMERFSDKKRPEVCIDDEIPFDIPKGWSFSRWNDLGDYKKGPFGSSLTKSMFVPKSNTSIKVYEQKNAIQKDFTLGSYYISEEKYKSMEGFTVYPGDIIISCAGTIGETYLIPHEAPKGIINQALMRAKIYDSSFIPFWLLFWEYILNVKNSIKGKGSAIKNIPPFAILKQILVPIPPINEQKRILNKYSVLIKKAEEYGKAQDKLDALNAALPEKLKNSILQEAIEGRLVPQNDADEPASALLNRIHEEKEALIKEKVIKRDKNESRIYRTDDGHWMECFYDKKREEVCIDDEIPFDIPDSWQYARLGNISQLIMGKTPERGNAKYWTSTIYPWVSISDMIPYGIIYDTKEKISEEASTKFFKGNIDRKGSLIMSFKLTIGRTSILGMNAYHNEAIVTVLPFCDKNNALRNFLFRFLPILANEGESKDAIKGKTLNSKSLYNIIVPIAPLEEQTRIVDRLNDVLPKVDNLK